MKERLLEFLRSENKSSAQLAEEIGVQPSGISHILSGRNNPSLDFVLKMLEKYQFLSSDWLLFGKGAMYKETKMQSLFDESLLTGQRIDSGYVKKEPEIRNPEEKRSEKELTGMERPVTGEKSKAGISRIVIFYEDRSFDEYNPRQ
jgi:transcriptional regulator with XRE-family HTH domain